jgi:hypothetical protein
LSSYGSALSIINQFCDDEQVKAFEISPVGAAALLILTIKDAVSAEIILKEVSSFFNSQVLSIRLIKNINSIVLKNYLSQAQEALKDFVLVQEFSFVSEAFEVAQSLSSQQVALIDFRVIRTYPLNVILVSSSQDEKLLLKNKENFLSRSAQLIAKPTQIMKDFFGAVNA